MNLASSQREPIGLGPIFTAVLWVGCVVVGVIGGWISLDSMIAPVKKFPPVQATLVRVDRSSDASHAPLPQQPVQPVQEKPPAPAPPPSAVAPSAARPMMAVATPSPNIAFAVPTSGPSRTVAPAQAVPRTAQQQHTGTADAAPPVQQIIYGVGESQQPKPDYPMEAQLNREYGTILVRYTIGTDGNVTSAQAIKTCPFAILNQAATDSIRDTWQFAPGPVRIAETWIEYRPK